MPHDGFTVCGAGRRNADAEACHGHGHANLAANEALLQRVDEYRSRYERIPIGTPLIGSLEAADRRRPLGELVAAHATIRLGVASTI